VQAASETRLRIWRAQPAAFFEEAIIDTDGTLAQTTGQCKEECKEGWTSPMPAYGLPSARRVRRLRSIPRPGT
jgi:hypothetical protein